jgi:hypothetical protein
VPEKKEDPWEEIEGKCNARKPGGGGLCRSAAGAGTEHKGIGCCKRHGGSTATHNRYAKKVKAEQAVRRFALPRDIDPFVALEEELARCAGLVKYYEEKLTGLTEVELEEDRFYLTRYGKERWRMVEVARTMIACGFEARRVRALENLANVAAIAVKLTLEAHGVDTDLVKVRRMVAENLRLAAADAGLEAAEPIEVEAVAKAKKDR